MATFTTDFSSNTAGVFPSDWAIPSGMDSAATTKTVVVDGTTKVMRFVVPNGTADYDIMMRPTALANSITSEILVKFRTDNHDYPALLFARYYNSGTTYRYLTPAVSGNSGNTQWTQEIGSYISPTYNILSSLPTASPLQTNTWYWMRFYANLGRLKTKVWLASTAEPASWDIDIANATHGDVGPMGIGTYGENSTGSSKTVDYGYVAMATNSEVLTVPNTTLTVQDSTIGVVSEEPLPDLPGSEGSVIYGGWGSFFPGSSYAGSGSGFSTAELGPYNPVIGISSDNVTLVEDVTLTVQGSTIGISSDAPLPIMDIPIIVQDSTIGISSENVIVDATVAVTLPDDSTIGISSDSPTLTQKHYLIVGDSTVGVSSDSVAVTQEHFIVVNDSVIAVSSDTPEFLQDYHLAVQEALIGLGSDNAQVLISFSPGEIDTGIYTPKYKGTAGELEGADPVPVNHYTPQAVTPRVWDDGDGVDTGSWNSP